MDFITIGEMLIDFIPGKEPGSYVKNAGGAPANVAIAAARNGLEAGIYCKVGDDDFGRFLLQTLRENQVTPLAPEMTKEAVTTMSFVSLNEHNDRSFTFARKPGADMLLDKSEIRDEDLETCRIVQAGSCSLSAGQAVEATEYAMARAHELGKLVGFDIEKIKAAGHDTTVAVVVSNTDDYAQVTGAAAEKASLEKDVILIKR